MTEEGQNGTSNASRLISCYFSAAGEGLNTDSIMLCEVVGNEIQSVSLRVAADAMTRWNKQRDA